MKSIMMENKIGKVLSLLLKGKYILLIFILIACSNKKLEDFPYTLVDYDKLPDIVQETFWNNLSSQANGGCQGCIKNVVVNLDSLNYKMKIINEPEYHGMWKEYHIVEIYEKIIIVSLESKGVWSAAPYIFYNKKVYCLVYRLGVLTDSNIITSKYIVVDLFPPH